MNWLKIAEKAAARFALFKEAVKLLRLELDEGYASD